MTYNEPIISYEFLVDLAEECHKNKIKFILKTNAYVNKEPWGHICKLTDAMNIDWKGSEAEYKEICGANEYVIYDRIKEAFEMGVHIEISVPVYSTRKDDSYLNEFVEFVSSLDKNIPIHLLRIFPSNKWNNTTSTSEIVVKSAATFLSSCGLYNVYI